jgi:hypothetical protein
VEDTSECLECRETEKPFLIHFEPDPGVPALAAQHVQPVTMAVATAEECNSRSYPWQWSIYSSQSNGNQKLQQKYGLLARGTNTETLK